MKWIAGILAWVYKWASYKFRMEHKLDSVLQRQHDIERRIVRLEILDAMKRNDRRTVYELYDCYKTKYNGNSYIDEMFGNFQKRKKK